jgi:hypothetical protein
MKSWLSPVYSGHTGTDLLSALLTFLESEQKYKLYYSIKRRYIDDDDDDAMLGNNDTRGNGDEKKENTKGEDKINDRMHNDN